MKDNKQLLDEYTDATAAGDRAWRVQQRIKQELTDNVNVETKRLRTLVRRLVKGTLWRVDECAYWPLISYGTRPVRCSIQGTIKLMHYNNEPRALTELKVGFTPDAQAAVLAHLGGIINSTR